MSSADSGCRRRAESPTMAISSWAPLASLHNGIVAGALIGGTFCHIMIRYDEDKQGTRRLRGCVEQEYGMYCADALHAKATFKDGSGSSRGSESIIVCDMMCLQHKC